MLWDEVNQMKLESDFLQHSAWLVTMLTRRVIVVPRRRHPLVEDLANMETISISHDSYNLLKFHGSCVGRRTKCTGK